MAEPYDELERNVDSLAGDTRGPDRYVVQAQALHIRAISELDSTIKDFSKSTEKTEEKMHQLATAQIKLAKAQLILGCAGIIAAVILGIVQL